MRNARILDQGGSVHRSRKEHCAHGLAGCVRISKNRKTGTRIGIYDAQALWREARAYINRVPHMADASTFWRGLSVRQVLASH